MQARLLRVLDERRVSPLGTEESHAVNFQLVSASHRHLPTLVREGCFREDLYYRLAGIEVQLPALRDRSDKRKLIHCVLAAEGGADAMLSAEAERLLMEHPWPGNIRQLGHVLRIAAALASGKTDHTRASAVDGPGRTAGSDTPIGAHRVGTAGRGRHTAHSGGSRGRARRCARRHP